MIIKLIRILNSKATKKCFNIFNFLLTKYLKYFFSNVKLYLDDSEQNLPEMVTCRWVLLETMKPPTLGKGSYEFRMALEVEIIQLLLYAGPYALFFV